MPLTRMLNPTGNQPRGEDKYGSGAFGASRSRDGKDYSHRGLDLCATPGQTVLAPCSGVVTTVALAYLGDDRYHSIHIQPDADLTADVKLLYVRPQDFTPPYPVDAGKPIGESEDLDGRYPGITNHCHLEVRIQGEVVDPTPLIFPEKAWHE